MNPIHLKTFLAVCRHLNYTRAAERLQISQPTVSRQIRQLEEELEVSLFDQLGKSLYVTPAGETLAAEAVKALGALDRLVEAVQTHHGANHGTLRVGASSTPGLYLLPRLLMEFKESFSEVKFDYCVTNSRQIEKLILKNDLDIGFVGVPLNNASIVERLVVGDEIICIASLGHPLAKKSNIPVRILSDETWIVREAGSATRRLFEGWYKRQNGQWRQVIALDSPETVKKLVVAGLGISFASRVSVSEELERGELASLSVEGLSLRRDLFMVQHVDKYPTPPMEAFVEMIFKSFPK
jgi:DNA-binding transcriptional LysR family regulator